MCRITARCRIKSFLKKLFVALGSWLNPVFAYYRARALVDRMRGLDFLAVIQPQEVGLDGSLYFKSSSSGNRYLSRMLKDLKVDASDAIVDVGCGKGGAMSVMVRYPFKRVDGIELSPRIAGIAERNLSILKARNSHIYCVDATTFPDYDLYTIIYYYNPFAAPIMAATMAAIEKAVAGKEREVLILYNNPTCHDVVARSGSFAWIGEYEDQWGHGIRVYSNRTLEASRLAGARRMRRIDRAGLSR